MDMTKAEQKLDADLRGARRALSDRQYHALERLLSQAALDARSLALLGPEGAAGIPVSHDDTRPCPACGAQLRSDDTHWSLFPEPMGGYVCPRVDDSPAGAGDSVEADRG
jgi:hypothetical protein